jgi:hypothetical protein
MRFQVQRLSARRVFSLRVSKWRLDAARDRWKGAQAESEATRGDIRLEVQSAFYGLAAAQDLSGVAERNLKRMEGHLALAQARWTYLAACAAYERAVGRS